MRHRRKIDARELKKVTSLCQPMPQILEDAFAQVGMLARRLSQNALGSTLNHAQGENSWALPWDIIDGVSEG